MERRLAEGDPLVLELANRARQIVEGCAVR
jgi:hypothetical protein